MKCIVTEEGNKAIYEALEGSDINAVLGHHYSDEVNQSVYTLLMNGMELEIGGKRLYVEDITDEEWDELEEI